MALSVVKTFFAVLLSPVLDGFDQLLSFVHCPPLKQCTAVHESLRHQVKKSWKRRELNPGRRGAELEHYRCAMATPLVYTISMNVCDALFDC